MNSKLRSLVLKYPQTVLIFIILAVYLYFQLDMMVRTTGDEKTYVAQALEMQRDGHWFMQTLFNEPDYYKGPLHFILVKIGFYLFGTHSIFATVYMNLLGVLLATLLLYRLALDALKDKSWALFYASSFSISIGLYAHSFASQMEAELIVIYAITLYLLYRVGKSDNLLMLLLLWMSVGLAGWLKSPAHSVFLGLSVLMYWFLTAQIKSRFFSLHSWLGVIFGIFVGAAGYIPIFIYDADAFIRTYIMRESLGKGANGVPWTTAFFPVFTYFLAPWMFAAIFSYLVAMYTLLKKGKSLLGEREIEVVKLSVSIITPTLLFFTIFPYRGDIYALPVVSATLLIAYVYWRAYMARFEKTYIWMMRLSALVLSVVPLALIILTYQLSPMPYWWPDTILYLAVFTLIFTLWFVFSESKKVLKRGPALLIFAFVPLFITIGLVLQVVGKAEMIGVKSYIKQHHITKPLGYYNLYKSYWNEYGSLNVWIAHDVVGLHTKKKLFDFLNKGGSVVIAGDSRLKEFKQQLPEGMSMDDFYVTIWKRWLTHGKGPNGESMFAQYFKTKDISLIQRDFYILKERSKNLESY